MTGSTNYDYAKAVAWRSGGSTQAEARAYNERLSISLIRIHGELSKVELTSLTGLAPQTISSLVNEAAASGLLVPMDPRRGGLGKPSIPYSIAPNGAFSFGFTIDADGGNLVLVNFAGEIIDETRISPSRMSPVLVAEDLSSAVRDLISKHLKSDMSRIAGLGVASPIHHEDWVKHLGISPKVAAEWARSDLRQLLDERFSFPVYLTSFGTAAATGEMLFGACVGKPNFLYVHLGHIVSGGLVLENRLFMGPNNMEGRLGDIRLRTGGSGETAQTLNDLIGLKSRLTGEQEDWSAFRGLFEDQDSLDPVVSKWLEAAAEAIASVVANVISVADIDCCVVDCIFAPSHRKLLTRQVRAGLARPTAERPQPFTTVEGTWGKRAFDIGAASVPLMFRYTNNVDVLLKSKA